MIKKINFSLLVVVGVVFGCGCAFGAGPVDFSGAGADGSYSRSGEFIALYRRGDRYVTFYRVSDASKITRIDTGSGNILSLSHTDDAKYMAFFDGNQVVLMGVSKGKVLRRISRVTEDGVVEMGTFRDGKSLELFYYNQAGDRVREIVTFNSGDTLFKITRTSN